MLTSSSIAIYNSVTILNTSHSHEVMATTGKAIKIAINDGRWGGDGAKHLWVPRSIIAVINYYEPEDPGFYPRFAIELPQWFITENKKKLV